MRAQLSEEQQLFAATVERLAVQLGPGNTGELLSAVAPDVGWSGMRESGVLGVALPIDAGGGGGTTIDLAVAAEAFGRHLVAAPLVGSSLALHALAAVRGWDDIARALEGHSRPVLATEGTLAVDGWGADTVVLITGGALEVANAISCPATADRSRRQVAAGRNRRGVGALDDEDRCRLEALALVLIAADLVGVADGAIRDAVKHVTERTQFGVPVGSFQSLKHLAADAHVDLVAASAAVRSAAWRVDHEGAGALTAARRAKAVAAEAGRLACETACQMLGGIGHTWEHLASVRLRRALMSRSLFGDERHQYRLLGGRLPSSAPTGAAQDHGFDLRDDDTEAGFRRELRQWLGHNPPPVLPAVLSEQMPVVHDWHRRLGAARYVGVSMPPDAGGRGLPVTCEAIVNEELAAAGGPPPPAVAHLATAMALYGTPEQRSTHLAGLLSGNVRWCQGFSEPGAGSDLAAITTRAALEDGDWVVNGRKIWTSEAAWSQWCLLLCRTEPQQPRHRGLSVLLLPLAAEGVTVTPIVTAWGTDEFAEVSFDHVRIQEGALLGERGQGWEIAMALLAVERGPADVGWIARFRATAATLDTTDEAAARALSWLASLEAVVTETLTKRVLGTANTSEGSIDKLLMTKVDQMLRLVALDQAGAGAMLTETPAVLVDYLWSRAAGIFGGTSQIQRNVVSERLLGLPR